LRLCELLGHPVHHLDESFGPGTRRGRILTGDQQAVGEDVRLPVGGLGKDPTFACSSSSTRKGTTLVRPTASSSVLVKPVTLLP